MREPTKPVSGGGASRRRLALFRPTLGESGADRVTLTLLQALSERELEIHLVLLRKEGPFLERVPAGVVVHELGARRLSLSAPRLARLLDEIRPEALLSTSSGSNPQACLARLLSRWSGRLVLSERNVVWRPDRGGLKNLASCLAKRALYPMADGITSVSEGVKNDLIKRLGVRPESVRVVYNPVVTPELKEEAAEPLPPRFAHAGRPMVLTVGRLVRQKNHELLLRAFARVARTHDARLVILGEGELRPRLVRLASELGIDDRLELPGFDPNPFRFMSRCSVFVLSSDFEGLPGALIQAMATGAAVVSTDCPSGPNEIIDEGVDGLLVPTSDLEALASAMQRILANPALGRALGSAARLSATRFERDRVVRRYERCLLGEE